MNPPGTWIPNPPLEIIDIFEKLNHEGKTVIMVTHEPELAAMTQRILVMRDGRLTEEKEEEPDRCLGNV